MREQELVWPIYLGWASVLVALVTVCVMWLTGLQLAGVGLSASAVAAVAVCLIYHDRARVQRREIEALRGEVEALRSQRGA
jgi:ABC-type bacteriocin/lantibiotic exporter with double-glycine peptidase domain